MKIKTSELTGAALDWAVAIVFNPAYEWGEWKPSTNWAQGGPIIEKEQIDLRYSKNKWVAEWWPNNSGMAKNPAQRFRHNIYTTGESPLIAAMRCYVASKLGDEVEIPQKEADHVLG